MNTKYFNGFKMVFLSTERQTIRCSENVGIYTRSSGPIVKPAESKAKNTHVYSNQIRSTFKCGVKKLVMSLIG